MNTKSILGHWKIQYKIGTKKINIRALFVIIFEHYEYKIHIWISKMVPSIVHHCELSFNYALIE